MSIWKRDYTVGDLNTGSSNTLASHLGIKITERGEDYLKGTMPVGPNTHQPQGILHGGASVALAETLGSVAGNLACDADSYCVGLEINANHLSGMSEGNVVGIAKPIHIGRSTHVWEIRMHNEANEKPVCISRITLAVLKG